MICNIPGKDTGREKMIYDVKSYRGANVDSDHHLVVIKINLRIVRRTVTAEERRTWNVDNVTEKNYITLHRENYKKEIENELITENISEDVNREWKNPKAYYYKNSR